MAGEWEEIPQDEFNQAQTNFLNSKEGFISNLLASAGDRGKEVINLGNVPPSGRPYPGSFGGQVGTILGGTLVDFPAMIAAGSLGGFGLPALLGYGYVTSPGETSSEKAQGALMTGLPYSVSKGVPKAVKGYKDFKASPNVRGLGVGAEDISSSKSGFTGVFGEKGASLKDIIDTLKRPKKIEDEIEALKPEKTATELKYKEGLEGITDELDNALNKAKSNIIQSEEKINDIFGDRSQESARGDVSLALNNIASDISNQSVKNYNEFEKGFGDVLISNPINFDNLLNNYGLSDKSLKSYPQLKPLITKLKTPDTLGKSLGQQQPITHTVQDYLQLYRTLRDLSRENKLQSYQAIGSQKAQLLSDKKAFDALRKDVQKAKLNSLDDEGQQLFNNAQNYYKNYVTPLRNHAGTRNILEKGKVPNNYFDALNQPGLEDFRNLVMQYPNARQALSRHGLIGKDFNKMSPDSISKLLSSDIGKTLSDEIRNILKEYGQHKQSQANLEKIKSGVKSTRISKSDAAMKEVFKKHPEFERPFHSIKEMHSRMKKIERELMQKGLDKQEAEEAAAKYWKIVSGAKTIKTIKDQIRKWLPF